MTTRQRDPLPHTSQDVRELPKYTPLPPADSEQVKRALDKVRSSFQCPRCHVHFDVEAGESVPRNCPNGCFDA